VVHPRPLGHNEQGHPWRRPLPWRGRPQARVPTVLRVFAWLIAPELVDHNEQIQACEQKSALDGLSPAAITARDQVPAPKPVSKSAVDLRRNSPVGIGSVIDEPYYCPFCDRIFGYPSCPTVPIWSALDQFRPR
jgi:hypothetical protein